jgi:hypothetical protein
MVHSPILTEDKNSTREGGEDHEIAMPGSSKARTVTVAGEFSSEELRKTRRIHGIHNFFLIVVHKF